MTSLGCWDDIDRFSICMHPSAIIIIIIYFIIIKPIGFWGGLSSVLLFLIVSESSEI